MVVVLVVKMLIDADGGANDGGAGEDEGGCVDGRGLTFAADADEPNAAAAAHEEVHENVDVVVLPSQAEERWESSSQLRLFRPCGSNQLASQRLHLEVNPYLRDQ